MIWVKKKNETTTTTAAAAATHCFMTLILQLYILLTISVNLISSQIVTTRVPLKIPSLEITNLVTNFVSMLQKIVDER
ncbi:hypothetical protein X798_02318 [Onchocerca flexuosa]|uniref:Transmembrane protein n=1 Tax=Onchocerca flexuosa TaxID=387005 RepID=A0A238BZD6_9BILA|nr:hypothetical protein X798_02318 [Onchocerca flexuosa]